MEKILKFFKSFNNDSIKLSTKNIPIICDLIDGKCQAFEDKSNSELMHYFAMYFEEKNNISSAKYYYLIGINNNYYASMNNLASIYYYENKYKLAIKYFLIAANNNFVLSMANLAYLYYTQKEYDLAEQYYLMAIDNNHVNSMNNHVNSMNNLVNIYVKQNNFDKIRLLYTKYDANINKVIKDILSSEIKINDDIIKLLKHFDMDNDYKFESNIFTSNERYIFQVFKKLTIIPLKMDLGSYKTFNIIMGEILPQIHNTKPKIYKNIAICICRKLFDNEVY